MISILRRGLLVLLATLPMLANAAATRRLMTGGAHHQGTVE